jgi:coenzyme PQQ precursor peptide PqqA
MRSQTNEIVADEITAKKAGEQPMRTNMRIQRWSKPKFIELRFGFEVTMYVAYR